MIMDIKTEFHKIYPIPFKILLAIVPLIFYDNQNDYHIVKSHFLNWGLFFEGFKVRFSDLYIPIDTLKQIGILRLHFIKRP